jgi:hypothetical protein
MRIHQCPGRMSHRAVAAIATLCLSAMGCAAQMVVPPEIAESSDVIAASERSFGSGGWIDESFKLGPYAIDAVHRKWTKTTQVSFFGEDAPARSKGGYDYRFAGAGVSLSGECVTKGVVHTLEETASVTLTTSEHRLGCTCSGGPKPVTLMVSMAGNERYQGELQTASGSYRVNAIHEREPHWQDELPTGYRIDGDLPRGAVEVLRPGRAWFSRDTDPRERAELACLYAGLMLYIPPRE